MTVLALPELASAHHKEEHAQGPGSDSATSSQVMSATSTDSSLDDEPYLVTNDSATTTAAASTSTIITSSLSATSSEEEATTSDSSSADNETDEYLADDSEEDFSDYVFVNRPRIYTDRRAYAPGEIIVIFGTSLRPLSTYFLDIARNAEDGTRFRERLIIQADAVGNIYKLYDAEDSRGQSQVYLLNYSGQAMDRAVFWLEM